MQISGVRGPCILLFCDAGQIIGAKGRCGQSLGIEEIALRAVSPGIVHGDCSHDLGAGNEDRIAFALSFVDYTALSQLAERKLRVTSRSERNGEESFTHVTFENPRKALAFFVRLKVTKGAKGEELLPVIWRDNYISLLPGEKREITASYRTTELGTAQPAVEVNGWNVQ